jgi:hypothetical protein
VVVFVTTIRAFRYSSSCVLLRLFVRFVTLLRAFGLPSCQLALHCVWVPLFPTRLALPLVAQPWPGSWCVSLRLSVLLGAHVANSPCVAFGRPSCELALRCARAPNLGEDVLKNLPPSQNWFLYVLRLLFLPSAPFVWSFSLRLFVRFVTALPAFRYGRSCVPLRRFVRLAAHLANWPCIAFGCPSCQLALPSPWSPNLGQAPRVFRYDSSCVLGAHVAKSPCVAFGRPSCELALRCVRVPNLGEAVLKNLPPSQNWFLSVLRLVFFPSAPFVWSFSLRLFVRSVTAVRAFRYGSSCVSLRPFVRSVTALRAFRYGRSCVPLRLFVRLGAHLANWPCIAFGCPSCQLALPHVAFGRTSCGRALRCVGAPNLGEAVLKSLPPSQNLFLSILQLVL